MEGITFPLLTALWLGILTSISPCPLASNIAAASFIIKRLDQTAALLSSGMSYILGRVVGYTLLGAFISSSLLSIPQTSHFLQTYMNKMLGPVLMVTGLFLLEFIQIPSLGFSVSEKVTARLKNRGMMGSLLLGVLFALSFCPISAAFFFGSLIPLSLKHNSRMILPSVYGVGTGLPVLIVAILIAVGIKNIGTLFKRITLFEFWMRKTTGVIFVLIGIYYVLTHIFYLPLS
jgi:hypothetical protein